MSDSTTDTATPAALTDDDRRRIKSSLLRYQVLAWITGLWLLLLVAEMILKYGYGNDALPFVPFVHGWVYFIYVVLTVDLGIKVRWSAWTIVGTAIAGTIPLLSFYVEHIRAKQVKRDFLSEPAPVAAGGSTA